MTAHRIIKSLVNRGNAVLGIGCYSAAMACQADDTRIIKVGTDMEDPWLTYYSEIIKPMQGNPFVPKVYSFYHDDDNNYFVCQMERLTDLNSLNCDTKVAARKVAKAIKKLILQSIDDSEFADICRANPSIINTDEQISQLIAVIHSLRERTEVLEHDDQGEYPADAKRLDLHEGNIMFRGNTPIIIDPWCHNVMDDVADLTNWAIGRNLEWLDK